MFNLKTLQAGIYGERTFARQEPENVKFNAPMTTNSYNSHMHDFISNILIVSLDLSNRSRYNIMTYIPFCFFSLASCSSRSFSFCMNTPDRFLRKLSNGSSCTPIPLYMSLGPRTSAAFTGSTIPCSDAPNPAPPHPIISHINIYTQNFYWL